MSYGKLNETAPTGTRRWAHPIAVRLGDSRRQPFVRRSQAISEAHE